MKQTLMVTCAALAFSAAQAANTWYVDDDNYNDEFATAADYIDAGFDGTTAAKAFGTIQMAIDATTTAAGDTILVCPGTYDKGGTNHASHGACRVYIHKSLTLESTRGAANTHIVGKLADTQSGLGVGAVRCVAQNGAISTLKGFTLRNGATGDGQIDTGYGTGDKAPNRGGAVFTVSGGKPTYVVDCVVSNCAAHFGIFRNGIVIRTLICDNYTYYNGSAGSEAVFYSCIIAGNRGASGLVGGGNNSMAHCSVFGNTTYNSVGLGTGIGKNNIIVLSRSNTSGSDISGTGTLSGNVTGTADGIYQFIAPAVGNFRVLAGSAADRKRVAGADGSDLHRAVPAEYRNLDFYGNPIPAENALPGAVQTTAAAAAGALQFDGLSSAEGVVVNGWKSIKPGAYVFPTNYPVQYLVSPALSSGKLYAWTTSSDHGSFHMPDWKTDTLYMMPPPSSDVVMTNALQLATGEVWLDPENGSDDTGDGTEGNPYETLQKGYSAAADYMFVYCKAGSYAKGGEVNYGNNRLYTHGRALRFVGVDGADETFIVGAADSSNPVESEPGCGPDAMRGIYVGSGTTGFEGTVLPSNFTDLDAFRF